MKTIMVVVITFVVIAILACSQRANIVVSLTAKVIQARLGANHIATLGRCASGLCVAMLANSG